MEENQLFDKVAVFTDIHFGRSGNDRQANQDNSDFITWFIEEAQKFGAKQMVFCGDWHNNRHNLHVSTMNYSLWNMERLNEAFEKVWFIPGNHDLFYRERRELSSVEFGRNLKNFQIISDRTTIGDVTFMPWLVEDEWKEISNIKSKYIFGHFELPHFFMNGMTEMPDHGGLAEKHFVHQDYVFSGHFHKRQARTKVVYIGNTFPFNFSDAWDDDRGAMFLEWGKEPAFKEWPDAPKYRTLRLSEMLESPRAFVPNKSYVRANIDLELNYEEANFIKDIMMLHYGARKVDLIPSSKDEENQEFDDDVAFKSIDQIVVDGLNSIQGVGIDKEMLIEIYKGLSSD